MITKVMYSSLNKSMYNNNVNTFRKQIFSGIQPTSIPHIGNYFGAIKQWVDLQQQQSILVNKKIGDNENGPMIISIVDLHAITLPIDPRILK